MKNEIFKPSQSPYNTPVWIVPEKHDSQEKIPKTRKTAFSTPHGHYEFDRMPFGLENSTSHISEINRFNIKCNVTSQVRKYLL